MSRLFPIFLAGLLFITPGCELAGPDDETRLRPSVNLSAQEQAVATSANRFSLKLFRAVSEAEPEKNVFLSPFSVSMALGMSLNGARDSTRAQMKRALSLNDLSRPEINAAYQNLISLLTELDPKVTFRVANSIWHRTGFSVRQEFLQTNKEYFDARVEALDFGDPNAAPTMNDWVSNNTNGKIEKIIEPPIDPLTVMYLMNATYFKGTWRYQFDESKTRKAPFELTGGSKTEVPMMRLKGDEVTLAHYRDERVEAVDLPYGDSLFVMTVLLPARDRSVNVLTANLDDERWREITNGLKPTKMGGVQLPKFKLKYDTSLVGILQSLGMTDAFDARRANLNGISEVDTSLYISEVKHKAFVEVNEEGTEAAAVTSVQISRDSAGPPVVRVDRPFVFAIREVETGSVLFVGKVMNPAA